MDDGGGDGGGSDIQMTDSSSAPAPKSTTNSTTSTTTEKGENNMGTLTNNFTSTMFLSSSSIVHDAVPAVEILGSVGGVSGVSGEGMEIEEMEMDQVEQQRRGNAASNEEVLQFIASCDAKKRSKNAPPLANENGKHYCHQIHEKDSTIADIVFTLDDVKWILDVMISSRDLEEARLLKQRRYRKVLENDKAAIFVPFIMSVFGRLDQTATKFVQLLIGKRKPVEGTTSGGGTDNVRYCGDIF